MRNSCRRQKQDNDSDVATKFAGSAPHPKPHSNALIEWSLDCLQPKKIKEGRGERLFILHERSSNTPSRVATQVTNHAEGQIGGISCQDIY